MTKLSEAFSETVSPLKTDVYFEALLDYEMEFLEPAAEYIIRTAKWFPKPVELRDAASLFRVEARRKALPPAMRYALTGPMLTEVEIKSFLDKLREQPENAERLAEIPRKGAEALEADLKRLDAIGARDMTDEKRRALGQFKRYLPGQDERAC
jgi:hypothetical protein